jgi:hypothetical protein
MLCFLKEVRKAESFAASGATTELCVFYFSKQKQSVMLQLDLLVVGSTESPSSASTSDDVGRLFAQRMQTKVVAGRAYAATHYLTDFPGIVHAKTARFPEEDKYFAVRLSPETVLVPPIKMRKRILDLNQGNYGADAKTPAQPLIRNTTQVGCFMRHSASPNAEVVLQPTGAYITAVRDIAKGEEVRIDFDQLHHKGCWFEEQGLTVA